MPLCIWIIRQFHKTFKKILLWQFLFHLFDFFTLHTIIDVSYIIINSNTLANLKFVYLQKELIYLITDEHNWINLNHIWTHVLRQKFRTTQEN